MPVNVRTMKLFGGGKERFPFENTEQKSEAPKKKTGLFASMNEWGKQSLMEAATKPRSLVCPQGIITYGLYAEKDAQVTQGALLGYLFSPEEIETKVKEILAVNPDALADENVQRSLGINILSFKKSG